MKICAFFNKVALTLFCFTFIFCPTCKKTSTLNANPQPQKTIIFDCHKVVFFKNEFDAFKLLPFSAVFYKNVIRKKLFEVLYFVRNEDPHSLPETELYPTDEGEKMPEIMCELMRGEITPKAFTEEVIAFLDKTMKNLFQSERLEKVIRAIIEKVMNPSNFAKILRPKKSIIRLIKKCKRNKYRVIMLTNIDSETVYYLKKVHPEVMALFDAVVVSADIGMMKPYPEIYHYVINTFALDLKHTLFIDDEPMNIKGAEQVGIKSFLFKPQSKKEKLFKIIKTLFSSFGSMMGSKKKKKIKKSIV